MWINLSLYLSVSTSPKLCKAATVSCWKKTSASLCTKIGHTNKHISADVQSHCICAEWLVHSWSCNSCAAQCCSGAAQRGVWRKRNEVSEESFGGERGASCCRSLSLTMLGPSSWPPSSPSRCIISPLSCRFVSKRSFNAMESSTDLECVQWRSWFS